MKVSSRSRQVIEITSSISELCRRRRRRLPRHAGKIEELRHVRLGGIARGETLQVEAGLNQLENRRIVHDRVRDEVPFGKRRNYNQREAISGELEIARWGGVDAAVGIEADVSCAQVVRRNPIGAGHGLWRDVIIEAAAFIPGKNKD